MCDIWRRAHAYDPADGTVLGGIMNEARSRAIDRVRFEHRHKRLDAHGAAIQPAEEAVDRYDAVELLQQQGILQRALRSLSPGERDAIQTAFFSGLTHAEVAVRLQQPLGTIKKIASVVPPQHLTRVSEKAARRNGANVSVFDDDAAAVAWLADR